MTAVGLGCVSLGSSAGGWVTADVRLVRAAVDLGVTIFDTADAYGNGASERVLGRALRRRRDEVVIATKGGFAFAERPAAVHWVRRRAKSVVARARRSGRLTGRASGGGGGGAYATQDFSPRHLRAAVHASLRRLRTDHIDVYQLHGPTQLVPGLLDEMADLAAVGDVLRFGIGADTVEAADAWTAERGIEVVQVPFGVLDARAAATTFPLARQHGCDVWVRGVLAGGLLALADRDPAALAADPQGARVMRLCQIAADAGVDQYQLAFGFVRAHDADVDAVLVGSTSVEHLRRNVELVNAPPLSPDVLAAVAEVAGNANQ